MDQDYVDYNPVYPLYVKQFTRGFSVHRMADDARIATIIVRDMSQVAGYQWDPITGKFLSIFYKDGTVRIYDGFRSGRLVSLLRASSNGAVSGIWDRIELLHSEENIKDWSIDHDVTEMMPKMVKFARDSRQLCVVPYTLPSDVWRPQAADDTNALLDAHVIRCHDSLSVMFDGEFTISIQLAAIPSPLVKFVSAQHQYLAFYQDGSVERFDLANLVKDPFSLRLLKNVITMRQLHRYLQDHIELIQRDLLQPYDEFLERCCQGAFGGYDLLREQLIDLMLVGDVTPELEDWLVNSMGEKNLKRWRKLGTDAYHKTLQVLTLACLPACERLISLGQRCTGNLLSRQLTLQLPLLPPIDCLQFFLKNVLEAIASLSSQQRLLGSFLDWFDDRVRESIDEDYKLRFNLHDNSSLGPDTASYLQLRLRNSSPEFSSVSDLTHSLASTTDCVSSLDSILIDALTSKINISHEAHNKMNDIFCDLMDLTVIKTNNPTGTATGLENGLILLATKSQVILLDPQSLMILAQLPLQIPLTYLEKEREFVSSTTTMATSTTTTQDMITRAYWQHTTLQLELQGSQQGPIKTAIDYQVTPNGDQWSLAVL
ncbi:ZYRO0C01474p [Zygosaccharomyces rouxii]|uniref:Anaphase-promoting complex subunit 4 n=1 Tax=Zygosaccharomyces rouxii (strain ATCC 2623 / CBS 732 / NBRC 1130 / NCYC 568 / NRRL Y-229) TaxID=559307 RepID=C5DSM6_ZYGRC|nr:uncharacterized protein ZYRO0C01474g [Zygosaccharomyces rouxii]KAH9202022.1 anaphase-promoting complex, cyclosome, subunit 4-domain-containing protein [Zygosaccharomyces rouxii]CAR26787.1 ZYRO0C01474p [Zygosaccharomyces rouxii]